MSKNENRNTSGVSILGLLGVAFVVLKLTGVIDWSWWWVTVPFWGGIAIVILIFLITALVIGAIELFEHKQKRR
ncbi:Transmembrane Fragile-X-F protein [compost metagenome]